MGWARGRWLMIMTLIVLVLAACGGGTDAAEDPGGNGSGGGLSAASDNDGDGAEPAGSETDVSGDSDAGTARNTSVTITVDGETQTYAVDDVVFSQVEGVDDLTFERCSPDFFGSGRFYAIGYAVDDNGEVLVADDGSPAGQFNMDLPPDDWEATQRDAPEFSIQINGLDIDIATPEEAAGGTMAWTVDDTSAKGTAVFVDFENTYTVEFDLLCEGSPTVAVNPATDNDDNNGGGGGGPALVAGGTGAFTADGESYDDVDVFSCEPFSFGSQGPHPDDLSILAFVGGSTGLEVEVGHLNGDGLSLRVFYSRQGDNGLEQFEGSASNSLPGRFEAGPWHSDDQDTGEQVELNEAPYVIEGGRITGSLAGLLQTWPDEGAAVVDVTWDLEIPSEMNEEC